MKTPIGLIPFHDWRKIMLEGFRTRDAHFIEEFSKERDRIKIIINRPTTWAEILGKRKPGLIKGKKVISKGGCTLYEIDDNLFLIDYISNDFFGQVTNGYPWFFNKYKDVSFISFVEDVFAHLKVADDIVLYSQNIFAHGLLEKLYAKVKVFDAWDNFNKFQVYEKVKAEIYQAYQRLSDSADFWTTNSEENLADFTKEFKPKDIKLISNGVDLNRFDTDKVKNKKLKDLTGIKRPIIGFGGKISQLIDVELLNKTMLGMPNVSFVFVGQILDKRIFGQIEKLPNFHYLGDKHYDDYPNYVESFDVCIVPYVVEKSKKSGANTIKVYEYLATGKKVVGTPSNGLEFLSDYVYLVNNEIEFIEELRNVENKKSRIALADYSWKQKVQDLLELIVPNNLCRS